MNHRCEMPMYICKPTCKPDPMLSGRRPSSAGVLPALVVGLVLSLVVGLALPAMAWEGTFELRTPPLPELAPPLPPTDILPVQLVIDDDLQEGAFGVSGAGGALQFLWFNRFSRPSGVEGFDLTEIWVLFPGVTGVDPGDPIQLVVYRDPDGDPTNGAELLAAFDETVQVADDLSFSVYSLPAPVSVPAGGDVLIGVVNRFVTSGATPPVSPATLDLTASQGRSWFALWSGDPPNPPTLPGTLLTTRIDDFSPTFAGNWMIRGFGTGPAALEIPTVSPLGLGLLALMLTLAAAVLLRRRRSRTAFVLALLTASLALPAGAQVTVDDFSTNQAEITAPPTSTSTVAGAGILGGNRDLLISATASAGLTSGSVPEGASSAARVDAGVLNFDALPSGPRTAQVTWDGDTDPDVLDPVGLGGVDLTAGGGSAFVLALASTADIQLEVEVFTDGSNSSFASRLLSMGAADIYIDFGEMAPAQGTGADFTNVGAIVLTLRMDSGAATLDSVLTAVPEPVAFKTDALTVDGDSDGDADPGDRLTYTITLTNTGGEARTVDLADTVDGNTTLVMGSVDATPVAKGDQYRAVGNVTLAADGTPGKPGLLANDTDPDGGAVMVASVDAMSAQGGSVSNLNPATGTFEYVPPAGYRGVDSFGYVVQDDEGNMRPGVATVTVTGIVWFVDNSHGGPFEGTQANPFDTMKAAEMASAPRDIIRVREGDGTDTGYGLGFICKPGQRIVGGAADLIIDGQLIEAGAGHSQHSHGAGNVFDLAGDHVIEGVEINPTTGHGLGGTGTSEVVVNNSIINPAGSADGVRLTNHSGAFTFSNSSITNGNSSTGVAVLVTGGGGTFDFSGSSIAQQGGGLVHVSGTTNAAFDFSGSTPTLSSGTDDGINLQNNVGGDFTFNNLGAITTTAGNGILVANSGTLRLDQVSAVSAVGGAAVNITGTTVVKLTPLAPPLRGGADITFPSLTSSNGTIGVNLIGVAPSVAVTGTTSVANSGAGINLESSGAVSFNTLTVGTTAGAGLRTVSTGPVTVTDNTSSVVAIGGPGADITNTTLDILLATLTSTNSTGRGLTFSAASGALNAAGGSITGVPNGNRGVSINGGSLGLTYGGTVTYTANDYAVRIQDTSAGFATFNAKVSATASSLGIFISNADSAATFADLDLGTSGSPMTNTGVQLINGSLGTFTFADTQIFTNGAQGFLANNGGVVQVTGPGNRVSATNARAITLENGTSIGGAGVTFQRLDASGADRGIRLAGAGSGFTVTGDGPNGTDGSGGTISSITQRGIEVVGTDNVTLRNLTMNNAATTDAAMDCDNLVNTGCHAAVHLEAVTNAVLDNVDVTASVQQGINGLNVFGFSLQNSTVANAGSGVNEGCLRMIGLTGISNIIASDLSFASERVALVENTDAPNLEMTVTGSTFRDTQSSGTGADGLELNFLGSSSATIDVVNSFFLRNRTNGLQIFSQGSSIVGADITGSTFDRGAGIGIGMDLAASDTGSLTFNVIGNPVITSNGGTGVNVFADNTSTIAGRINNNPNIQAGGGMTSGFGISVQVNESASGVVEISNNVVSNIGVDAGIRVISRLLGGPACGTTCTDGRLDATIEGNNVTIGASGLYDYWVQANDSNTLCADVRNNVGSAAGIVAFRERTNAAASTVLLEGFNTDAATTWANNGNTPAASVSASNNGTLTGGTCTNVSHPMP
jgi:uncharacterized repeat protein (TIGR01451 family)